jgi:Amt family ammonium transporter
MHLYVMTWHPDGLFFKMGVLDFAGGTVVVHDGYGISWSNVLGKRKTQNQILHVLLMYC